MRNLSAKAGVSLPRRRTHTHHVNAKLVVLPILKAFGAKAGVSLPQLRTTSRKIKTTNAMTASRLHRETTTMSAMRGQTTLLMFLRHLLLAFGKWLGVDNVLRVPIVHLLQGAHDG